MKLPKNEPVNYPELTSFYRQVNKNMPKIDEARKRKAEEAASQAKKAKLEVGIVSEV